MERKQFIFLRAATLFSLLVMAISVSSQPKEFSLSFSEERIEIVRGDTDQVEVTILKGKGYQKSSIAMGKSSSLPKGVALIFEPATGTFETTTATLSVQRDAIPGEYVLVLNATLNNKTKGSILTLLIK